MSAKDKHIRKINSIYSSEIDNCNKMHPICYDLIQEYFILSRGRNEVDLNMQEKLQNLVKLVQGQRSVKFDIIDDVSINPTIDSDNLNLHLGDNDNAENVYVLGSKRTKPRSFEYDAEKLIKEKRLNNGNLNGLGLGALNETRVLSSLDDSLEDNSNGTSQNMDSTFQIATQLPERNVLVDKNPNVPLVMNVDKKCKLLCFYIFN